jgi:hypothetical protein
LTNSMGFRASESWPLVAESETGPDSGRLHNKLKG